MGTSRHGLSCEVLTNLTTWHVFLASSHVLHTCPFVGYFSRKLFTNYTDSSLELDSSPISYTHHLQINQHKYRKIIE